MTDTLRPATSRSVTFDEGETDVRRMRGIGIVAIVSIMLASCALPPRPSGTPAQPAVVQIWEYPSGDVPTMCVVLTADGVATFRGGFQFFNPGSWRAGNTPQSLVITLGGDTKFPTQAAAQELQARPPVLRRFDAARRELEFAVDGGKERRIAIGGFYFYRSTTCGAA